ncbi:hypothetical protein BT96DRAFT_936307 [Gymnopus androsaceus JB14]|uniref:Uncharacterized protein n=1 Tax=Gymnopus androsaceus JB14 TaxID=1447944 RepID=A0A6A4I4H8_9AGAR|nr:hypothetical protein BT96DRAFT_936307 [Gymnopus androsaceus JB14]
MIQEHQATGPSLSSASSYNPSPTVLYPERVSSAQFHFITSDELPGVWLRLVLQSAFTPHIRNHPAQLAVFQSLLVALLHLPVCMGEGKSCGAADAKTNEKRCSSPLISWLNITALLHQAAA